MLLCFRVYNQTQLLPCTYVLRFPSRFMLNEPIHLDGTVSFRVSFCLEQGHNWIIVYSRPVYFCLCCVMIWIFDLSGRSGSLQPFSLYGVTFFSAHFLLCVRDMLLG